MRGQPLPQAPTSTGTGARPASVRIAAPSPWSVSTAGWIPRASSRSSASASCSSPRSPRAARRPARRRRCDRRELERHTEGEQPLLGTVVQVALQPAPLLIARTHDPRPRLAQLGKLRAQLGLQPLILHGEACGRPGRLEERRLIQQDRVVDDRRELISDESDCAVRSLGKRTSRPCSSTQPFCWVPKAPTRASDRRSRAPGRPVPHPDQPALGRRRGRRLHPERGGW